MYANEEIVMWRCRKHFTYVNAVICVGTIYDTLTSRPRAGQSIANVAPVSRVIKALFFQNWKVSLLYRTQSTQSLCSTAWIKKRGHAIPRAILRANKASINLNARLCIVASLARECTYRWYSSVTPRGPAYFCSAKWPTFIKKTDIFLICNFPRIVWLFSSIAAWRVKFVRGMHFA